jgi:Omp85 superfamily domain
MIRPVHVGLFGVLAVAPCVAQTHQSAERVDSIIIENRNVFDLDDDAPNWVARLANGLHVRTRQWVIRRHLLLNRGDPFDRARMEESERALRSLGIFRSVRVDSVRSADGKLAVRAVTADGWSTQPQLSFSSVGGDKTWEIGFLERNFLGTGQEVAVRYGRDPDRRRLDFEFVNPHFFGRRTELSARYGNLSDGSKGDWRVGLPFYETAARYSLESFGQVADERVLQFRDGALLDSTRHHLFQVGINGGVALQATTHAYTRLWGAWEWRREDFAASEMSPFPYSVFTTFRAGFELGSIRFRVLEQFNSYARREDVDLSPRLRVGVVVQSGVGYEVSGQTSAVWKRGFALLRVSANGLDSTRTKGELTIVSQNVGRHTMIAHAEGGLLSHPRPGAEFDPWLDQSGPRLFGIHSFTGTRTTWLALEDRIVVADNILGLLAFGLAPFFDYGGAWFADESPRQGGDVGLSLRFGPTRAVRGNAEEVAFGYMFGQGVRGKRWGISIRKGLAF